MVNGKLTTHPEETCTVKSLLPVILLLVAACSRETSAPITNEPVNEPLNKAEAPEAPLNPPAPGEPGGLPDDRTPISEGPIDPKSAQGAGQILQTYFALLESGKANEAGKLWSDSGTPSDFANRLAKYREVHANIGAPGDSEGAAGSIYVEIPVQLYGRLQDGKEFNARGSMTLRRVNDVPGSTAAQRKWHIYRADFPAST